MFWIGFFIAIFTGVVVYFNTEYVAEFERLALAKVPETQPYARYIAAVVLGIFWPLFWAIVLYQKYADK